MVSTTMITCDSTHSLVDTWGISMVLIIWRGKLLLMIKDSHGVVRFGTNLYHCRLGIALIMIDIVSECYRKGGSSMRFLGT